MSRRLHNDKKIIIWGNYEFSTPYINFCDICIQISNIIN